MQMARRAHTRPDAGKVWKLPDPATSYYFWSSKATEGLTCGHNFLGKKMYENPNVSEKTTLTLTVLIVEFILSSYRSKRPGYDSGKFRFPINSFINSFPKYCTIRNFRYCVFSIIWQQMIGDCVWNNLSLIFFCVFGCNQFAKTIQPLQGWYRKKY